MLAEETKNKVVEETTEAPKAVEKPAPEAPKAAKAEEAPKAAATTEVVADKKPEAKTAPAKPGFRKPGDNKFNNKRGGPRKGGPRRGRNGRDSEFEEKVIDIARVTTVVKGGRRFSFSALVVIGNKKGKVGWGHGKANEVPDSIKKAIKDAKNNMITCPIIDKRTVPHDQLGKFLASQVLVKPAPKGKGVIASGSIRSVVELAGYHDIYTKSLGSRSKTNSVKATINALAQLRTIEEIAKLRDVKVEDIQG